MDHIHVMKIFNAVEIAASGSAYKDIHLDRLSPDGFFSIQLHVTGDGTCKMEYLVSLDGGVTWLLPGASGTDGAILSSITKTSGPSANGKIVDDFDPIVAPRMRILITETGTSQSVTVSVWICIQ
jgi:hypothetical protein